MPKKVYTKPNSNREQSDLVADLLFLLVFGGTCSHIF